MAAWLFLLASGVGLWFTFNALFPVRRTFVLLPTSFVSSWLTGELALHHIVWQGVAAAVFVALGALDSWPGWVALGLTVLSWAGLAWLLFEATKAEPVIEEALQQALGPAYRDEIAPDLAEHLDERFSWRQRLLPVPVVDRRVERIKDVAFRKAHGRPLCLDVYRAREPFTDLRPTLLQIHGGGWVMGRKDDQALPLMLRLAAHGWVCVSANYRLSPHATFPDHIIDVKDALRWIREHGAEFGADPDFVVLTGGSAGGHLAALAALTPDDPEYQSGFEDTDTSVAACVPFYGVYDFTDRKGYWEKSKLIPILERHVMKANLAEDHELFDRASPVSRAGPEAPPFLVIHGTRDTLVPVDEARQFVETLRIDSDEPVAFAELPGAQHAFEVFPSLRTGHTIRGVERFVAWVYTRHRARTRPPDEGDVDHLHLAD